MVVIMDTNEKPAATQAGTWKLFPLAASDKNAITGPIINPRPNAAPNNPKPCVLVFSVGTVTDHCLRCGDIRPGNSVDHPAEE